MASAILALIVVGLLIATLGQWATIDGLRRRNAELEAMRAPPTAPPCSVIRARDVERVESEPQLPQLVPLEGNDEPTKICRIAP